MATLQVYGDFGLEVEIQYARLHHKTSPARRRTTLTGHTQGTRKYRLVFRTLPDQGVQLLDSTSLTLKTKFDYLWDFYEARRLDGASFDITSPLDGTTVPVRFADYSMTYTLFQHLLYSVNGIQLVEARSATLV